MRRLSGESLRIVIVGLAALVVAWLPFRAAAGEAITMPFSCAVKGGKPTLKSAAPTRHEIAGERQHREYRACKDKAGRDCRTMVVHRFNMQCQGVIAPWPVIAAQIRSNDVGTSKFENGELQLLLKNADAGPAGRRMAVFVMPKGYAPITELGARLTAGTAADNVTAAAAASAVEVGLPGGGGVSSSTGSLIVPKIGNAIVVETAAEGQLLPAVLDLAGDVAAQAGDGWQAVVAHGEGTPGRVAVGSHPLSLGLGGGINVSMLAFVLAGTSLLAALAWFGRRYSLAMRVKELSGADSGSGAGALEAPSGDLFARMSGAANGVGAKLRSRWVTFKWRRHKAGKPWEWRNASIANGARAAEALYEKAEQAVRTLGPASALRDTLSAELRSVRQRIEGLRGGSGDQPKTARVAASLRSVVRDLERIGRIAESASASAKGAGNDLVMPKTRAQAFEVLGVNADATEGTLKRIVDALRMGWHPDHAKDEDDKMLREERTKQINIAWDLIVGKRAA